MMPAMLATAQTYVIGPNLEPGDRPWPIMWEQDPAVLACIHLAADGEPAWETVLVPTAGTVHFDEVVRCRSCHAPRCGEVREADPCMRRRHHDGRCLLAVSGWERT